ncbi:MAG: hypothetical protein GTO14_16295 [Anaerolineales bacterium]|nr:hypothetical protein [Anaerolineales bacterium]
MFSPPLLFVIVGLRKNLDSRPVYTFMAVSYAFLLVLAQGLFYRERWSGTFGWGLRSILPALPGLFPLMAPTIDGLISGYSPTRKVLLWGMLILSVVIQVSGAIVPWHQIFLDWQAQGLDAFGANAAWKIRFLSIPHHILRLAKPQEWSMVWSRLLQAGEYGSLLIPTLSLMLGVVLLRRILKPVRAIGRGRFLILILSAFIIPSAPTWWAVSPDPAWGGDRSEFQSALNAVEQEVKEQDVVIIDSYGTPLWVFWMNRWRQPAHWFSTPFELPAFNGEMETLSPSAEGVLLEIVARGEEGSTVWYVRTNETPDFGTHMKRQWLERRYDLKYCVYFTRTAIVEVCAFRLKERIGSIHKPAIVLD